VIRPLFLDQSGALGGAELYLLDLARAYHPAGRVLLFDDGPFLDRLQAEGLSCEVLPAARSLTAVRKQGGLGAYLRGLPGLAALVSQVAAQARRFDLIFANTQKALVVGGLAGLLARRPVVWNLHDLLTTDHFSPLSLRASVWAANWLTCHVIANSRASRSAYRAAGGSTPASVVYNGLDPAPFDAISSHEVTALRTRLGLGEGPVIGVFSRLANWKGQHVLVEAVGRIRALVERIGVQVLLVGDALFEGDRAYAEALRAQVEARGLADRVHFLGFRDDVPALMRLCDVVVHTSTAPEPFGRVIVEGMLAERPVVATAAGGATEILVDGRTGRLVPAGDPGALATVLSELLDRPDDARRLGRAGALHARATFGREPMLRGVGRILRATCPTPLGSFPSSPVKNTHPRS